MVNKDPYTDNKENDLPTLTEEESKIEERIAEKIKAYREKYGSLAETSPIFFVDYQQHLDEDKLKITLGDKHKVNLVFYRSSSVSDDKNKWGMFKTIDKDITARKLQEVADLVKRIDPRSYKALNFYIRGHAPVPASQAKIEELLTETRGKLNQHRISEEVKDEIILRIRAALHLRLLMNNKPPFKDLPLDQRNLMKASLEYLVTGDQGINMIESMNDRYHATISAASETMRKNPNAMSNWMTLSIGIASTLAEDKNENKTASHSSLSQSSLFTPASNINDNEHLAIQKIKAFNDRIYALSKENNDWNIGWIGGHKKMISSSDGKEKIMAKVPTTINDMLNEIEKASNREQSFHQTWLQMAIMAARANEQSQESIRVRSESAENFYQNSLEYLGIDPFESLIKIQQAYEQAFANKKLSAQEFEEAQRIRHVLISEIGGEINFTKGKRDHARNKRLAYHALNCLLAKASEVIDSPEISDGFSSSKAKTYQQFFENLPQYLVAEKDVGLKAEDTYKQRPKL